MTGTRTAAPAEEPEEHVNHERWLVTYADTITLLMVLFIVLFAISQVDQKKFAALATGARDRVRSAAVGRAGQHQRAAGVPGDADARRRNPGPVRQRGAEHRPRDRGVLRFVVRGVVRGRGGRGGRGARGTPRTSPGSNGSSRPLSGAPGCATGS